MNAYGLVKRCVEPVFYDEDPWDCFFCSNLGYFHTGHMILCSCDNIICSLCIDKLYDCKVCMGIMCRKCYADKGGLCSEACNIDYEGIEDDTPLYECAYCFKSSEHSGCELFECDCSKVLCIQGQCFRENGNLCTNCKTQESDLRCRDCALKCFDCNKILCPTCYVNTSCVARNESK